MINHQLNTSVDQTRPIPAEWAYYTVPQFTLKHKAFTIGGIRSWIFNEYTNGLAESGAIVRIGRKVLIQEPKFFLWVKSLNKVV
jgi:hypothetical protein